MEPQVHYRIHSSLSHVHILNHINQIHASPYHFLEICLIISFHLPLGLRSGLFSSGLPTKALYATLLSPIHATCRTNLFDLIITNLDSTQISESHNSGTLHPSVSKITVVGAVRHLLEFQFYANMKLRKINTPYSVITLSASHIMRFSFCTNPRMTILFHLLKRQGHFCLAEAVEYSNKINK